jgi:hypothetical protein
MFPTKKMTGTRKEIKRKTEFQILAPMFSKFIPCVLHTLMALEIGYCDYASDTAKLQCK